MIKALDRGPDSAAPFCPTKTAKKAPSPIGAKYMTYETTFDIMAVKEPNNFIACLPASPDLTVAIPTNIANTINAIKFCLDHKRLKSLTDIEPSYILTSISLSLKFEYIDLK